MHRYVYIIKHVKSEKEFEILLFYTLHISIDLNSLDKLKMYLTISLYGNWGKRRIWFGTIFPYMEMEGIEGMHFSNIINTIDVAVLLELVPHHSSIDCDPIVLFLWEALHLYEKLYMHRKSIPCYKHLFVKNDALHCINLQYLFTYHSIVYLLFTYIQ